MRLHAGVISLLFGLAAVGQAAEKYILHSFDRRQLSDQFFSEGASFLDVNHDGAMDIVSGPFWYAGPKFIERSEIYSPVPFDIANYSDNFFTFAYDVNGDDWTDVIVVGFPGKEAFWYQNPQGKAGHWQRHLIHPVVDNESPDFTDITGDGRPDLVFHTGGRFGYAEIPSDSTQPWEFHPVSGNVGYERFTHGLGIGDVNGDGRADILEKSGWWEQPAARSKEMWKHHKVVFSEPGGAQMFAYDVDGDGDNDVITSKAAHAYGLSWFENVPENGEITFREHQIMGERPEENEYGVAFSQLHALALADMNQDGILDIVTGKRFWAHAQHDPGALEPAVLYWFQTVRDGSQVRFVPHRVDVNSGVGTQVVARDVNGDKLPDIVVGNKKGTFVMLHRAEPVDRAEWEQAQPKRRNDTSQRADKLFNGRDLSGWTGEKHLWSVEDGEIVGRSPGIDYNSFLVSDLEAGDFRLSLEVKLVNNDGNSGVQFRSRSLDGVKEIKGYQADIGSTWWGKLYEENGRALLSDKSGEQHLKPGEWNKYEIEAKGPRIRTWLNGKPCVDLDDPDGAKRGIFALQIHAGDPMEVRFRNLELTLLDEKSP